MHQLDQYLTRAWRFRQTDHMRAFLGTKASFTPIHPGGRDCRSSCTTEEQYVRFADWFYLFLRRGRRLGGACFLGLVDRSPDARGRVGKIEMVDAERTESIDDGVGESGDGAGGAGLAGALGAEQVGR